MGSDPQRIIGTIRTECRQLNRASHARHGGSIAIPGAPCRENRVGEESTGASRPDHRKPVLSKLLSLDHAMSGKGRRCPAATLDESDIVTNPPQ